MIASESFQDFPGRLSSDAFLKRFGPDALPAGPELAALMGRIQFLIHGYENDPAELYGIPEVRKFYQHFHRVWPSDFSSAACGRRR